MQIDNNVVMDVEEFNPVNTDEVGEQENGATSPNDIEESPQLLDVSVVSSVGDDVLPVSPCSSCTEKSEKIIALQKTKSCQRRRLKRNKEKIRSLNREIRQLGTVSWQTVIQFIMRKTFYKCKD